MDNRRIYTPVSDKKKRSEVIESHGCSVAMEREYLVQERNHLVSVMCNLSDDNLKRVIIIC